MTFSSILLRALIVRSMTFVAVGALLFVSTAFAQSAPPKIGVINSDKILASAPGRADMDARLEKEMGATKVQLRQISDSLQMLEAAFSKAAPSLPLAKREVRAKTLRDQQQALKIRARVLNQQITQRYTELVRPLKEQMAKVVDDIRTQGHYASIVDVSSSEKSKVAVDKSLNLTEQVSARLKQLGPPKSGTQARAGASTAPTPEVSNIPGQGQNVAPQCHCSITNM
jgi:Skp family chaperone for outer membrane proteins